MSKAFLSRIAAAVVFSLPLTWWFTWRTEQRVAHWLADPQGAHAAYVQELQRALSFRRDVVFVMIVCITFVLCIEGLAYVFRGGE